MLLELHCHTKPQSACSALEPETLLRRAADQGLDGVVITEHHAWWSPEQLQALRHRARIAASFVILSGQEVETELGHVLVFGPRQSLRPASLQSLRDRFPDCATVWAHPWRRGRTPDRAQTVHPLLDAVEIFNTNQTPIENYRALSRWHTDRFTAIAGSDAHDPSRVGKLPTQLDHPVATDAELAREIRAGRCRPYMKEHVIEGRNSVIRKLVLGAKGPTASRNRYIIRHNKRNHEVRRAVEHRIALLDSLHKAGMSGRYRVPGIIATDLDAGVVIEEGLRGKRLSELFPLISDAARTRAIRRSLDWLGRFHRCRMCCTSPDDSRDVEMKKLRLYRAKFRDTGNRRAGFLDELIGWIERLEERLYASHAGDLLQVHGDFQPDNIILGQDMSCDPATEFVAAIDFDRSMLCDPARDVGYFIAQSLFQFREVDGAAAAFPVMQLGAYWASAAGIRSTAGCAWKVKFFMIRAQCSIMAFLVMVGMGASNEFDEIADAASGLYDALRDEPGPWGE
jgi:aminoglycoside phosphotransferase (APT) family kinase protein